MLERLGESEETHDAVMRLLLKQAQKHAHAPSDCSVRLRCVRCAVKICGLWLATFEHAIVS
eukprot:6203049-Pleurochrysis_carterae.AAC.2